MKVGRGPASNGGALLMRHMVFNSLAQLIVTQVKVFPLGRIILIASLQLELPFWGVGGNTGVSENEGAPKMVVLPLGSLPKRPNKGYSGEFEGISRTKHAAFRPRSRLPEMVASFSTSGRWIMGFGRTKVGHPRRTGHHPIGLIGAHLGHNQNPG